VIKHIQKRKDRKTVIITAIFILMFIFCHIQENGFVDNLSSNQDRNLSVPPLVSRLENYHKRTQQSPLLNTNKIIERKSLLNNEEHDPIGINGNLDFITQANNENWPGEGSESSPYVISGFNISDSEFSAIQISNTNVYFQISNCTFIDCGTGISLDTVSNGHIFNNTIYNSFGGINERGGILVTESNNNMIENNTIYRTEWALTLNIFTSFNIIYSNTLFDNINGFWMTGESNNNRIINNNAYNNDVGILIATSNTLVKNNTIYDNGIGIEVHDSNNTIVNNSIYGNEGQGIWLNIVSHENIVVSNTINNNYMGIEIERSSDNYIANNSIFNNSGGMWIGGDNNTVNGNMIYNNLGCGIDLLGSYNTISGNNVSGNGFEGIRFSGDYEFNNIEFNNIEYNIINGNGETGINLNTANHNLVAYNEIYNNPEAGISLSLSLNNTIFHNLLLNNSGDGIYLGSSNNNHIIGNIIYGNSWHGIRVYSSNSNAILNNTLRENGEYGVSIDEDSSENVITWNSFINNTPQGWKQAFDDGSNSFFFQNCWSDLIFPDSDSDGIVDLPYFVEGNANNNDSFPLVTIEYEYMNIDELMNPKIQYPTADIILNGTVNVQWTVSVGFYHIETQFINLIFNIQYSIHFSSDGGENWLLLANNLTTNQYLWDTTSIPDSSNCLIKVITSNANDYAIETISGAFSIRNNEGILIQLLVQILSISFMVFCTIALGYYIVTTKVKTPSFTEYFQSDKIEFLKPLLHKIVIGLDSIQTAIMSESSVTPLLEEPTMPTSLASWFPDEYRENLKSDLKGRTVLILIEIAFQYAEDANLTKLAQNLNIPSSTLSDELKKLIKLNYLDFHVTPQVLHDSRYRHYIITSKGISFLKVLKSALELSIRRIKEKEPFISN